MYNLALFYYSHKNGKHQNYEHKYLLLSLETFYCIGLTRNECYI